VELLPVLPVPIMISEGDGVGAGVLEAEAAGVSELAGLAGGLEGGDERDGSEEGEALLSGSL